MSRTCIILSPYFPPSSLAGVHRARHLAKHLPAEGWTPVVLCVHEVHHAERLDADLARLVATTEVVKVGAMPAWLTRLAGFGELSLRGFLPLRRMLLELLRTRRVDAVLITGSPYYPMLLSRTIKRRFGVPVVLDFQDPWVSAWGERQPRLSKGGVSHAIAKVLEPRALRGASYVTSVSETQNTQLAERYPWLDRSRMAAIPIGSDPEDFSAVPTSGGRTYDLESGYVHISYVGTIWPEVHQTLRAFLRGVAMLRTRHPELYKRLRVNFVGTTGHPNDTDGFRVTRLAAMEGVADVVVEIPERVAFLDALSLLRRSNANLMLGSGEPHYTASKIYPYLMSERPYLSVFHRASSGHEILAAAGGGVALAFSSSDELSGLEGPICDGLRMLAMEPDTVGTIDQSAYRPFEARYIAHNFAVIFDHLREEQEKS